MGLRRIEVIKRARELVLGHALAGVGYNDADAARGRTRRLERNLATRRRQALDRVPKQVVENAAKKHGIA
jgi:hypothetical protein